MSDNSTFNCALHVTLHDWHGFVNDKIAACATAAVNASATGTSAASVAAGLLL